MKYIKIKTQFEGFHRYKKAPKEVSFLRNLHRHIFGVIVKISVEENNRELEFFIEKRKVDSIIDLYLDQSKEIESCEMIAEFILDHLETIHSKRKISVEVNEDNENGSVFNNYERFSNE